jgi:nucleotide-binding universal stress UspA family protein
MLVALDDSVRAPRVLRFAVDLARGSGTELILFRAVAVPQEFPAAGAGAAADELTAKLVRTAHEELMTYVASELDVALRVVVKTDVSPENSILAAAEELDVDLIVIGNHGYRGWDRVLGTTALHVVQRATRNVVIVHRGVDTEH